MIDLMRRRPLVEKGYAIPEGVPVADVARLTLAKSHGAQAELPHAKREGPTLEPPPAQRSK